MVNYQKNECEPEKRRVDLESYCREQESCMHRDPEIEVSGIKVVMRYIVVEVVNQMVEPLSYKALAFLFALIILTIRLLDSRS